jgi:hypothetical protein
MQTIPICIWSSFIKISTTSKVQYFSIKLKTKNLSILKWEKSLSRKFWLSKGFEIILKWMEIGKI